MRPSYFSTGLAALICLATMMTTTMADEAFSKTDPETIEVKQLPAGRLIKSESEGNYFEQSGQLFRPLFNYIQTKGISMTTPVEARVVPGEMYFWVAAEQRDKADEGNEDVDVLDVPARNVASIGARGAYSQANFDRARAKLLEWIESEGLRTEGEPYGVYWNGPFTPWFLKTFEVHIQIDKE